MTRRSVLLIIAAAILPLILLLVMQVGFAAREQRQRVENDALAEAKLVIAASDAELARTIGALDVLSRATAVVSGDIPASYERARGETAAERDWAGVTMSRAVDGAILFDTRRPLGTAIAGSWPEDLGATIPTGPVIRSGEGCPCVTVSRRAEGVGGPYLLTVHHSTRPFLRLLPPGSGKYEVSALSTREGIFVARSLRNAERVGRPGTKYLRSAAAGNEASGLYSGYTLEGFANYTAFARSRLTGWSAHVAMSNRSIDALRLRSFGSLAVAGLLSLVFAALLIFFVLRQISEGRRSAERLQQTQKLEALGQLTGGIAHDFNNLLTPIVGALDYLSKNDDLGERPRRIAANGLASANRAAKLTGQLLAFSRQQKLSLSKIDLCVLLEDIRSLLEQSAGGAGRLELDIAGTNCWVETDPLQLELALINLVINARDASPPDEIITVSAAAARLHGAEAWKLTVADRGTGMPEAVRERAFEPFFTTKQTGRGTGLGLAQVFAFARQTHGEVQIDSAPGEGTRVAILLPTCPPPPGEAVAPVAAAPENSGGLDILIVDDQPEVRETITLVLEEEGHRVEAVESGAAALAVLAERKFALGVIDFAMPGMNGAELIAEASTLDPGMRFIIVTGYLDSDAVEAAAPGTQVLAKPFDPERLRRIVWEVVGSSRGEG